MLLTGVSMDFYQGVLCVSTKWYSVLLWRVLCSNHSGYIVLLLCSIVQFHWGIDSSQEFACFCQGVSHSSVRGFCVYLPEDVEFLSVCCVLLSGSCVLLPRDDMCFSHGCHVLIPRDTVYIIMELSSVFIKGACVLLPGFVFFY